MKTYKAEAAAKIQFGLARKADFEALSVDDIRAIKGDQEVTHYRFVERGAKADESDEENRTVVHVASSEHVDSMGDIIRVAGWDTVRIKLGKIPLLPGHNPQPIPLGLVLSASKRGKCEDGVKCLETKSRFYEQELYQDSEWGKHVEAMRTLVLRGDMPGVSVGFVPKDYRWPEEEERETLGMPRFGMIFEQQELLELSVTPIPANNRAQQRRSLASIRDGLRELVAAGKLDAAAADELASALVVPEDAFLIRAAQIARTIVPITRSLPWAKGGKAEEPEPLVSLSPSVDEAVKAIRQAAVDAVATITDAVRTQARREISAVSREILEPLEDAITEAADEMQDAATRLGLGRKDSERAEVSTPSASTEADAATAASTGTSRDNPTTPAVSRAGHLLLTAIDPAYAGADTAHGSPDRSDQARGVQDGR